MAWTILYGRLAQKDTRNLKSAGLQSKVEKLLRIIEENPFEPPYEKLNGDLRGAYSRRINIQHRLVYLVFPETKTVRILRMWTHYE